MNKIITVLFLICILVGCKKSSTKEENYTLTGTVLDFDANTPIAGAKVYVKEYSGGGKIIDSAISDVNGKVSFAYKKEGAYKFIYPSKDNYLNPIHLIGYYANYDSRTEVLYLAKPSFINVTVHKNSTYLPLDTVAIQVLGDHSSSWQNSNYRILLKDKAEAPDKILNLQAVYGKGIGSFFYGSLKLYFIKDIIRNGSVISTQTDSTNFIQFGIKNYTLNY